MRKANKTLDDVHYYIPQNKAAYDAKVAQKKADAERAKAQAAADAEAALRRQYAELQKKFGVPNHPPPPPPAQPDLTLPGDDDDDVLTQPPSRKAIATLLGDEGNTVPGNPDEYGHGWGWY